MSRKLFVGNLPYETMEQDLETLFGQAGQVETVSVMRDRVTGRARGFAFVEMASDEDAQKAITQLNGHQLGGTGVDGERSAAAGGPARWRRRFWRWWRSRRRTRPGRSSQAWTPDRSALVILPGPQALGCGPWAHPEA